MVALVKRTTEAVESGGSCSFINGQAAKDLVRVRCDGCNEATNGAQSTTGFISPGTTSLPAILDCGSMLR